MSVVVAIKANDRVYLGCDSQSTRGGTRTTLKNPNNYKIWNVRGVDNCVMGHVGLVREGNIIRLVDDFVSDIDVFYDRIDFEFVVKKVRRKIIETLQEESYLSSEGVFDHLESSYFFAYKERLFLINDDGSVLEIEDYAVIGSGRDQALGSLLVTEDEDPRQRIVKAIKCSAATDIYVDYPIVLLDTSEQEFEIIVEDNPAPFRKDRKETK